MHAVFLHDQIAQSEQALATSKKAAADYRALMQVKVSKTFTAGNCDMIVNNPRVESSVVVLDVVIQGKDDKKLFSEGYLRIYADGTNTVSLGKFYQPIDVTSLNILLSALDFHTTYVFENF